MSVFLGQPSSSFGAPLLQQSDDRNQPKWHVWDFNGSRAQLDPWADGMLWPRSRLSMGGDPDSSWMWGSDSSESGRFESDAFDICGGQQRKKIIGNTLDASGNPLGSCVIRGYLTSNNTFIGQTTSDSGGYYELTTSFAGQAHYIVAYQSGSPDIAGTSINTLIPV